MKIQSSVPLAAATGDSKQKDDLALKRACGEFESFLVAQMLHKMRDTVQKSDLFGSREKEDMFQSMLDDEIAKDLSNRGSIGLADLMYQQLSGKQTAKVTPETVDK